MLHKLLEVQKVVRGIKKDASNPFFNSKYSTLEGILHVLVPELNKQGLFLTQRVTDLGGKAVIETTVHDAETKELFCFGHIPILQKSANDPQAMGSGISFARRYAISAAFSLFSTDDDGNEASQPEEIYTGSPEQKRRLMGAMQAIGITDPMQMKSVHDLCLNKSRAEVNKVLDEASELYKGVK